MQSKYSNEIQGIAWMLLNAFWFSVMTSLVRYLSTDLNSFVIVFFRNIFAMPMLILGVLPYRKNLFSFTRVKMHFPRGCIALAAMTLWYYSITIIPLPEAVALSFITPLFTTIAAIIFLKEKAGYHRWTALVIGFIGALIILRPTPGHFNYATIFVIITTLLWAASNLLTKNLTKTEHPNIIVFYLTLFMAPLSLPLALTHWQWPNKEQIMWLFLLGITANLSQKALSHAIAKTDMTVILPFDFTRLVFISIIAYFAFNQKPDIETFLGALLIITCAVYVARREAKLRKAVHILKINNI